MSAMDDFCAPSRWGPIEYPRPAPIGGEPDIGDFTRCFEEIVIIAALPLGALVIFTLFSISRFMARRKRVVVVAGTTSVSDIYTPLLATQQRQQQVVIPELGRDLKIVTWTKLVSISLLVLLPLTQLAITLLNGGPNYYYVSMSALTFCFLLCAFLTVRERQLFLSTSPALLAFYVLLGLSFAVKLRTILRQPELAPLPDTLFFVSFAALLTLLGVSLYTPNAILIAEQEGKGTALRGGLLSRMTYWWISPLLRRGRNRLLRINDLFSTTIDSTEAISAKFEEIQDDMRAESIFSLPVAVNRLVGNETIMQALAALLSVMFSLIGPFCLYLLVWNIEEGGSTQAPEFVGLCLLGLLFGPLIVSILDQLFMSQGVRIGMTVRAAIMTAVYKKSMRLSVPSIQSLGIGGVTSLLSVEAERIRDLPLYMHRLWAAPLQIIVAVLLLVYIVGVPALAGLAVMFFVIPVNYYLSRITNEIQMRLGNHTDGRIGLLHEILSNIRSIKLMALEGYFFERLRDKRASEFGSLRVHVFFQAAAFLLWQGAPVLVTLATFGVWIISTDEPLTARMVFASLALFNLLKMPLYLLPMIISKVREGRAAYVAVEDFLNYVETPVVVRAADRNATIKIREGGFKWDDHEPDLTLRNINLDVRPQQYTAVVGGPGSGKSSLLLAILGELVTMNGSSFVRGKIAYAPPTPWLQKGTIRDNILFGAPFVADKYEQTVAACELTRDFVLLEKGDMAIIDPDSPSTLSPGQEQRIALARAVYCIVTGRADLALFDNPLSNVEPQLAKRVLKRCMMGLLKDCTRVLVLDPLLLGLQDVDYVVLMENGQIVEQAPIQQMIAQSDILRDFIEEARSNFEGAFEDDDVDDAIEDREVSHMVATRAISGQYERMPGAAQSAAAAAAPSQYEAEADADGLDRPSSWRTMLYYLGLCGGLVYVLMVLVVYTFSQSSQVLQDFVLAAWVTNRFENVGAFEYFSYFSYFGLFTLLSILVRSFTVAVGSLRAARGAHDGMLAAVFAAPVAYFEQSTVASVMARLGRDMQIIDQILSAEFSDLFTFIFLITSTLLVITLITPFFIIAMLPVAIVFHFVAQYYISTARQLKRLDGDTRGDVYGLMTETLVGMVSVRATEATRQYIVENERRIDVNHRAYWNMMAANRWLGLRLEFVGSIVVFFAGLFVIISKYYLTGGRAGLSLMYALSVTNTLNWLVRTVAEVDVGLAAVHRTREFADIKPEAPAVVEECRPPRLWPTKGKISIQRLLVRHPATQQPVLNGISLETKRMEKVGIVGPRGAGKTALVNAIFRLQEPESGTIRIDNVDLAPLGVRDLRMAISIVPAEPLLFSGTVRANLDPGTHFTDYDLWNVLRRVHLDEFVAELPSKLFTLVSGEHEGGGIFSPGQLQLLSLARALLRNSKVLVVQDSDHGIDPATEALIQKTIRLEFTDTTVLCVTRKLRNIIDYDRVAVLDKGSIIEYDLPANLLNDESSAFHALCVESGEFEQLRQLAGQKEYVLEELSASLQSSASIEGGSSFLRGQLFSPVRPGGGPSSHTSGHRFSRANMRSRSFVGSFIA